MYNYTRKKIYDSDLYDLTPKITSDSLNVEIMIVERTPSGYRACVVVPGSDIAEHRQIFILHRERDHYESMTPFNSDYALSCGPAGELINNSNPSCNDISYSISDSGNQDEIEKSLKPSGGNNSARILSTKGPIEHTFVQTSSDADTCLTICCWNTNGLSNDKLMDDILANKLKMYDIILLSGTRVEKSALFEIEGYDFYNHRCNHRLHNARRESGGLGIFVRVSLKHGVDILHNHSNIIAWINLRKYFFNL